MDGQHLPVNGGGPEDGHRPAATVNGASDIVVWRSEHEHRRTAYRAGNGLLRRGNGMRALTVGLAALGSAVLLVPLAVTAEESPSPASPGLPASLTWTDASGDLQDPTTGEPTDGPGYADIIGLDVSVDGDQLTVHFDVAEAVPEPLDSLRTTVAYRLDLDTDGDGSAEYLVQMLSGPDRWLTTIYDIDRGLSTPAGDHGDTGSVVEGDLTAIASIAGLGTTANLRFQGLVFAGDTLPGRPGDRLDPAGWLDRVPDAEDEWRALGESQCICDG